MSGAYLNLPVYDADVDVNPPRLCGVGEDKPVDVGVSPEWGGERVISLAGDDECVFEDEVGQST